MKGFITPLLLLFALSINAQGEFREGFIIDMNGDSLYGFIKDAGMTANSKRCIYKEKIGQQEKEFLPSEMKAYRFLHGRFYVSKRLVTETEVEEYFFEYLLDGIVDLYTLQDANGVQRRKMCGLY